MRRDQPVVQVGGYGEFWEELVMRNESIGGRAYHDGRNRKV
jgi:hypothetical protein